MGWSVGHCFPGIPTPEVLCTLQSPTSDSTLVTFFVGAGFIDLGNGDGLASSSMASDPHRKLVLFLDGTL